MNPPVFLYYRLTNFYQNNRKYVKSFNSAQLLGSTKSFDGNTGLSSSCSPLAYNSKDETVTVGGVPHTVLAGTAQYYPCGLIANSFFSDVFSSYSLTCVAGSSLKDALGNAIICGSPTTPQYGFTTTGITWPTDQSKYGQSDYATDTDVTIATKLLPPPYWRNAFPQYANGYNASNLPNLANNEPFQVWMRTAALPTFRKLAGKNLNAAVLPTGHWSLDIVYNFDVSKYGGTKSIVISTVSLLGGKNAFLGTAYVVVGSICWALGIAFLLRHMISPRKLGDHRYLSWNQQNGPEQVAD